MRKWKFQGRNVRLARLHRGLPWKAAHPWPEAFHQESPDINPSALSYCSSVIPECWPLPIFLLFFPLLIIILILYQGFPVAQTVKNLPAVQETQVRSLGQEDPLEKEIASHSSILACRIPWIEEAGGLQSMGSQRVRHN